MVMIRLALLALFAKSAEGSGGNCSSQAATRTCVPDEGGFIQRQGQSITLGTNGSSRGEGDKCKKGNNSQCEVGSVCGRYNQNSNSFMCCANNEVHGGVAWCANREGERCSDGINENCAHGAICGRYNDNTNDYQCCANYEIHGGVTWCAVAEGGACSDGVNENCVQGTVCGQSGALVTRGYQCCSNWIPINGIAVCVLQGSIAVDGSALFRQSPFLMTHDSATGYAGGGLNAPNMIRTQGVDFVGQLACGARAFDMRTMKKGDTFEDVSFHHGSFSGGRMTYGWISDQTVRETIPQIINWCQQHPNELVVILLSHCYETPKATTGIETMKPATEISCTSDEMLQVFTELGVPVESDCSTLDSMTLDEAKSHATMDTGGRLLLIPGEGYCVESNYDPGVTGQSQLADYSDRTMAAMREGSKPFQAQEFLQQSMETDGTFGNVPLSADLNAQVLAWIISTNMFQGVNFLEMNLICAYGNSISQTLGAQVTMADQQQCAAACSVKSCPDEGACGGGTPEGHKCKKGDDSVCLQGACARYNDQKNDYQCCASYEIHGGVSWCAVPYGGACNDGVNENCATGAVCGRYNDNKNDYQCCANYEIHGGVTWCAVAEGGACSDGVNENCVQGTVCGQKGGNPKNGYECCSNFTVIDGTAVCMKAQTGNVPPYNPVFFMHGIQDYGASGNGLGDKITEEHPGTKFITIDLFEGAASYLTKMLDQLGGVRDFIRKEIAYDPEAFTNGFNLLCHSQGGLLCRGVINTWDPAQHGLGYVEPKVFISMAGPQMGVVGYGTIQDSLPQWVVHKMASGAMYTKQMQRISFGGYWKDVAAFKNYQESSTYLAPMNNEAPIERCYRRVTCHPGGCYYQGLQGCVWPSDMSWDRNPQFKAAFNRLEKAVFFGSPDDGAIVPWQSTVWGYYDVESPEEVVSFNKTDVGKRDLVPLNEMLADGRAELQVVSGIAHTDWLKPENVALYIKYLK
ncbi:ppt2-b [Symbiodinium natans]|uniref:palmitoyl-CoA hydrolase n=1 Tax=Symbiodinium natans TaxID=878477 RepID=A0A812MSJ9_9DINO|nr:ppt2-b [Symbiodinium natans]